MAVMNPCCCELRLGVTIVAIVNMALSMTALIWYTVTLMIGVGLALAAVAQKNNRKNEEFDGPWVYPSPDGHDEDDSSPTTTTHPEEAAIAAIGIFLMVLTIVFVLSCLITFVMSIVLFLGARKREIAKCRLWYIVTLLFLAVYVIFKLFNIGVAIWAWGLSSAEHTPLIIVTVVKELVALFFSLAIEGYQLWVVYAFMDELKREQSAPSFNPAGGVVYYAPKPGDPPPPYGNPTVSYTGFTATTEGPSGVYPYQPTQPLIHPNN